LTDDLYISNITQAWQASENGAYQYGLDDDCANMNITGTARRDPCITAWVAQTGTGVGFGELRVFLRKHQFSNDGWGVEKTDKDGWDNKIRYVASNPNASITFEFKEVATNVKVVTIFFLRIIWRKMERQQSQIFRDEQQQ